MKTRILLCLIALAAACGGLVPSTAHAQDEVSFDFFYDSLRPYGDWVEVADYGLCWKPASTNEEWAPYTDGYWSYTDGGWTWVSYEDFGGIVYHYGRWTEVDDEGWCWVPGYDWGPAWVSWRNDDEHVGWAPLPPECKFTRETGVSTWVDNTYDIGPTHYRFCRVRDFGAPVIREVLIPRRENVVIIRNTVNVTNISVVHDGIPFCGGPRYDFVRERCVQPIPTLVLVRETNIVNINNTVINNRVVFQGVQRGNTISFPAPRIRAVANPLANPAYRPVRTVANAHVNRGWKNVPDAERQVIKTKFQADTKGATPQTKKAVAPVAADLKPVPAKADPNATNVVTRRPPNQGIRGTAAGATLPPGGRQPGTPGVGPSGQPLTGAAATPFAGRGKGKAGVPNVGPNGQPATLPTATPFAGKGKGKAGAPNVGPDGQPLPGPAATPFAGRGKGQAGAPNVGPDGQPLPGPAATPFAGRGKGKAGAPNVGPDGQPLPPGGRPKGAGAAPGEPNPANSPTSTTEPRPSTPGAGKGKGKNGAGATTRTLPGPSDAPPVPSATTPTETRPPGPAPGSGKGGKGKAGGDGATTRTLPGPSDTPSVPHATPGGRPKGANVPTRPPQTEAPVNRPPTTRPQPKPQPQVERPQSKPQPQVERPQPKPQVQQPKPQAQQPRPQPQVQQQPRPQPQAQPQPRPQPQAQQRPPVQQRPQPQAQQPQVQRPAGAPGQRQLTEEEKKKLRQQQQR